MKKILYTIIALYATIFVANAETSKRLPIDNFFAAAGSPANPKVKASWNFYRNLNQIEQLCKDIAKAYPDLAKVYSIGKSTQGNEMWALTISDFNSGNPDKKPATLIFANIHSNEIQATTVALYTAWYLTEMYGNNDFIRQLLKDKTFYIIPTINPDAREYFMYAANTGSSPRAGMIPIDSDRDGYVDEDGYDDLDGDLNIVQIRRKSSTGRYIVSPNNPNQMIKVANDQEKGEYELLGYEGFDNDGDGRVNEDGVGGYDPNRDFGYSWEPNHIQSGAYKYPLSIIENRNVVNFVMAHPNIAAGQTYHNAGGMILTPPGSVDSKDAVNRNDKTVYDYIAKKGEQIVPGYNLKMIYRDLYTTVGSDIDFLGLGRGVFMYCNELLSSFDMFNGKYKGDMANERSDFDKWLLFGDGTVDWKEFDHPDYGKIEIGGAKKTFGRIHAGFMLESAAHRNMAYTLFYAYHTPKLAIESVSEKVLPSGLVEIEAVVTNSRIIPTHSDWDIKNKISRPDWITLSGANIVSGMVVVDPLSGRAKEQLHSPECLKVNNIPGNSKVAVRWLVEKGNKYTITVDSPRGGTAKYTK